MPVSALQINYTGVLHSNGELIWRTDTYHYAERVLIRDKYFDETLKSVTISGDAVNISAGDIVYELTFKDAMNLGLFGRGTVVMPEYSHPISIAPLGVQFNVAGVQSNQFLLLYGVFGTATATVPVIYGDYSLYSDVGSSDSWAKVVIKDRSGNIVENLVINQYSDKTSIAAGLTVKVTAVRTLLDGTIVGTDLIVGAMNTIEKIYPQTCDISGTGSSDSKFPGATEWCIQVLGGAQAGKISAGDKIYVVFKPISSRTYSAGGSIVLPNGAGTITFGTQPTTTTTLPTCPYSCITYTECTASGGSCRSGYACIYGCCCYIGAATTTTVKTTTTTVPTTSSTTPTSTITTTIPTTTTTIPQPTQCAIGTATATSSVSYGNYRIYSDLGVNGVWARVIVKNQYGSVISTVTTNQGSSYDFTSLGFSVKVITVRALQDGTVVGTDISVSAIASGAATATNGVQILQYNLYSDLASNAVWARIVVKDKSGSAVATAVINQGSSYNFVSLGITVKVVAVRALQDGTVVGVDVYAIQLCPSTTTTIPATCSDTDGGLNYIAKGTCTSRDNGDNYDSCDSISTLSETYCSSFDEAKVKYGDTVHGPMCFRKAVDCAATVGTDYVCLKGECVNPIGLTRYNPSVVILPSSSASGMETVNYTVFVKNNDYGKTSSRFELKCNVNNIGLEFGVRCGFVTASGTVARIVVTINPGEAVYTPLKVWTTWKKVNATVGFNVTATNTEDTDYWVVASGTAQFGVEETKPSAGKGTETNPVKYGEWTIYSDLGRTDSWARIIIKDAVGNIVDNLLINQGSEKTSVNAGLTITLISVKAGEDGTISSADFTVKSMSTSTATASTPVVYGAYSIYSDLGMAAKWARVIIKDSSGKTVDTLVINQGGSKISETSGLEISVITVTAKEDGTIMGADLVIKSAVTGTATATVPVTYGDYRIYSDLGATDSWARIIIKDTTGKTVDTKNVNQRESWNSGGSGLHIAVVKVRATQDGTIVGVDLIVNAAPPGASSTASENPVVKSVRNFYTWISGVFRQ
jgi:hypothetical protein